MKAASTIRKLPLNALILSPINVRKTLPSAAADAELKASLRASGLKQNLVVHVTADDDEVYAVTAGGRRLKALQELAAEGDIPADYKVPCVVEEAETALETSLMENTIRAPMHPADEFTAMAELVDTGEPLSEIALRFGVSERVVTQRLRLGKLAPKLLDAFRKGDLSLELVMAFTLASDHKTQLAAWRQIKSQPYPNAHAVRRLLTEGAVRVSSSLGVFVGTEAYEAAGGAMRRDLFSDNEDGFMDDAALVRRLAIEKLEAKAEDLKAKWSWTKALLDPDYGFASEYGQIKGRPAGLSPKLAKELAVIEQRISELEDIDGDDWTDELTEESDRLAERHAKLMDKGGDEMVFADEDRARAGCIVTIGDDGDFEIHEGLLERGADGDGEVDEEGDGTEDDAARTDEASGGEPSTEQPVRKECGFSQGLIDDLKAHRLQITKAHLAGNFTLAFDLALYSLCLEVLAYDHRGRPLSLSAVDTRPRSSLNDLAGTPADRLLETRKARLEIDWLFLPAAQAFEALSALPVKAKEDLFAWCVAACFNGQLGIEDDANSVVECAGHRLAIPFAEYWRPTAANYWGRTKKAHGVAVATALLGERWGRDHADDKKAILAAALEEAFDPATSITCMALDQSARDAAGAWLPPGMAYAQVTTPTGASSIGTGQPASGAVHEKESLEEDLPPFLTGDDPGLHRLNGSAPD